MYSKFGQFIDGKWQKSSSNETYDVINPSTEEVIGKASKASSTDIEKALKSAEKGFMIWKKVSPWERALIIRKIADLIRKRPFAFLALMLIIPLFVTAPHVLLDSETPKDIIIQPPEIHDPLSDGFILIILDGVGENWMLDEVNMPLLNERRETGATLNLRTGPLTLSATCVSEIMNGVPNSPSDGLRNFNLEHPGGDDAWKFVTLGW